MQTPSEFKDCVGRDVNVGDRVAVAFALSKSIGYVKVGTVESLEFKFRVRWDENNKISPPMKYKYNRVVLMKVVAPIPLVLTTYTYT